jgi:hypothetical protein
MILVDTSVLIAHFQRTGSGLEERLAQQQVLTHPFVIGELACGRLTGRVRLLEWMGRLPSAPPATHEEAVHLLESHRLMGRGLGWVDVHLLASARLAGAALWTLDRPLGDAARACGVVLPTNTV